MMTERSDLHQEDLTDLLSETFRLFSTQAKSSVSKNEGKER